MAVASRIKIGLTGQEYEIGKVGTVENVGVHLTATGAVWTGKNVIVQNISKSTSATIALNASGECIFQVTMGDTYQVTLPTIDGYTQPPVQQYTAMLASRTINYTYTTQPVQYEQVNIQGTVFTTSGQNNSVLEGYTAVLTDAQGTLYNATFNSSGLAQVQIPYGKTYTVALPSVPGYGHGTISGSYVAGLVSRSFSVVYQTLQYGVCGVDANGRLYSIAECEALTDKSIIIAGRYNDADLQASSRGDGTYGNGFMWKIDNEILSNTSWCNFDIEFDISRLPNINNDTQGLTQMAGALYTRYILEIAEELRQQVQYASLTTGTAIGCQSKTLTINGVLRNGILLGYGQFKRLINNITSFQSLYIALGKTAPSLTIGSWSTSCQKTGNVVTLNDGNYLANYQFKSYIRQAFIGFDI